MRPSEGGMKLVVEVVEKIVEKKRDYASLPPVNFGLIT